MRRNAGNLTTGQHPAAQHCWWLTMLAVSVFRGQREASAKIKGTLRLSGEECRRRVYNSHSCFKSRVAGPRSTKTISVSLTHMHTPAQKHNLVSGICVWDTDPSLQAVPLAECQSVGFCDDRNNVHFAMDGLHEFNIQWLQSGTQAHTKLYFWY